ncbi:MAG: hypothetical protein ABIP89_17905 [Polyangiaceae bacterium]
MTACGKCGENIPEPAGHFCGVCGAPVTATTGSVVRADPDTDPLARTAPADPKEIAKIRSALASSRAPVAPTVNDLVLVPEPGAKVQVEWSDGKKYPATVKKSSTEQCLVLFPDGQEKWVELRLVSPA